MTELVIFPQYNDAEGNPADVALVAADGTSVYMARRDHAHQLSAAVIALFAPAVHTHAGEDIVSGTVADARIASTVTRDSEVFGIVLAADGTGSGLDADLLRGTTPTAFGLSLLDDAAASNARTTLGLGTIATFASTDYILANGSTSGAPVVVAGADGSIPLGLQAFSPTQTANLQEWRDSAGTPLAMIDASGRLGIGVATVGQMIESASTDSGTNWLQLVASNVSTRRGSFVLRRARGTVSVPLVVASNDSLGDFFWSAYDGSAYQTAAIMGGFCDGAPSAGSVPMRVSITTGTNSTDRRERIQVKFDGAIIINDTGESTADLRIEGDTDANLFFTDASADAIGIGTNAPTAVLDVKAPTTARASLRLRTGVAPTSPNDGDLWYDGTSFYLQSTGSYSVGPVVRTTAIQPLADSTTALRIFKANGSTVVGTLDTTNSRFGINSAPQVALQVSFNTNAQVIPAISTGTAFLLAGSDVTTRNGIMAIVAGNAGRSEIHLGDQDDIDVGRIYYVHTDNSLRIDTNVAEALRITSTGYMSMRTAADPVSTLDIGDSATGAVLTLHRIDASIAANDPIGKIQFYAADASTTTNFIVADIEAQATNTISTDINPGRMIFRTTSTTVAATPTERMRIDENGYVSIGQPTTPSALLDVAASTTTRASLRLRSGVAPTTPNEGDIWFDGTDLKIRIGGVTKTFTLV